MSTTIKAKVEVPVLEPAAASFVEATAKHPFIFELSLTSAIVASSFAATPASQRVLA